MEVNSKPDAFVYKILHFDDKDLHFDDTRLINLFMLILICFSVHIAACILLFKKKLHIYLHVRLLLSKFSKQM